MNNFFLKNKRRFSDVSIFGILLTLVFVLHVQITYSQTKSNNKRTTNASKDDENAKAAVGFWKYSDTAVWIHISKENKVFQCRIAKDNTIFSSFGTLKDNKITWENIWETDEIRFEDDKILLKGKFGEFSYNKTDKITDSRCKSPLELSESARKARTVGSGIGIGSGTESSSESDSQIIGNQSLKIISKPAPVYTKEARDNKVEGNVILRVTFMANGQIGSIKPVKGLPYGLTEMAIAAARSIKFEPSKRNGNPISVTKSLSFSFTLK